MESESVRKRTIRAHTKQSKDVLQMISGSSSKAVSAQTTHMGLIAGDYLKIRRPNFTCASCSNEIMYMPWNLCREIRP